MGGRALIAGLVSLLGLALAGCHSGSAASPASASASATGSTAASHAAAASASPSLSIPGTHKATTVYQISSPVNTVVVISHAGNITISGTGGSGTSVPETVTEQAVYSKTAPTTTRVVSGKTLTITYSCPVELVCGVAYVVQVPRGVAVRATAGAGAIRLSGLAGNVTAEASVGFIDATGLTGSSVSLTTGAGGIAAAFTAAPRVVQATARVGAITIRVPGSVSYQVSTDAHLGTATVSVPEDPSSARSISASTDVGTITVGPAA